ncbi:toll/interleukin-1 receptor domain-containing protein [Pseudofrankia inefficax]|uniref:toll/interleukin-1 receptor domain-containing protein n=1 Tax=Pseudofrankia inefficax (strain DSM 45817 / CECT 9037 / DDB 130130 / EuI1c) TaxID=298654 RepID=UPI00031E03A3|nr:toll/interleukin-1 receptor domain-containing protein [Pseudofrankia inefficax]
MSYTGADEAWATWVAAALEKAGRTVSLQVWDSPAGTNVVVWINEQMTAAKWTIAICSPAYFDAHWSTYEWAGALAGMKLIPLRVADCPLPPILAAAKRRTIVRMVTQVTWRYARAGALIFGGSRRCSLLAR